jgi:hypothetical protein
MQGPVHTAAEWARIARSTNGQDQWWSHELTRLSLNQIVLFNERGYRCHSDSCGEFVEFRGYSARRRAYNGGPMRRHVYLCRTHAKEFAEEYGLDWPPYVPEKYRERE